MGVVHTQCTLRRARNGTQVWREEEEDGIVEFADGEAKLELSEGDISRAVEFWLNERILRNPCVVSGLKQANSTQWQAITFYVSFNERQEEGNG